MILSILGGFKNILKDIKVEKTKILFYNVKSFNSLIIGLGIYQ